MVICFDFFGLPGSGKSTVSHLFAVRLRNMGESVLEMSYELDRHSSMRKKVVKLVRAIVYCVKHPKQAKKIYMLVKRNGYSALGEIIRQLINILIRLSDIESAVLLDNTVMVQDQGIYQAAVSLSIKSGMDCRDNVKIIQEMIPKECSILPLYLSISAEKALYRMSQRGTSFSRIEQESSLPKKREMLEKIENACNDLAAWAESVVDGNYDSPVILAEKLSEIHLNNWSIFCVK